MTNEPPINNKNGTFITIERGPEYERRKITIQEIAHKYPGRGSVSITELLGILGEPVTDANRDDTQLSLLALIDHGVTTIEKADAVVNSAQAKRLDKYLDEISDRPPEVVSLMREAGLIEDKDIDYYLQIVSNEAANRKVPTANLSIGPLSVIDVAKISHGLDLPHNPQEILHVKVPRTLLPQDAISAADVKDVLLRAGIALRHKGQPIGVESIKMMLKEMAGEKYLENPHQTLQRP